MSKVWEFTVISGKYITKMLVKNIGLIFMVTDKFTIRVILDYCNLFKSWDFIINITKETARVTFINQSQLSVFLICQKSIFAF